MSQIESAALLEDLLGEIREVIDTGEGLGAEGGVIGDAGLLVAGVVAAEHLGQALGGRVELLLVGPGLSGVEDLAVHAGQAGGHLEAEELIGAELGIIDAAVVDGINAGTSRLNITHKNDIRARNFILNIYANR